jgi:hypothetical protein
MSFNVDSDAAKLRGEASGNLAGTSGKTRMDMDITSETDSGPMTTAVEVMSLVEEEKTDYYFRYKNVSAKDPLASQQLSAYFKPVLGKWIRTDVTEEEENRTASFQEDGASAMLEALAMYAPVASLNDKDRQTYLAAINKYGLYQVENQIENTRFRGIEARKLLVSINKETLIEFERELSSTMSEESRFQRSDTQFIDQLFAGQPTLTSEVYVAPNTDQLVGVAMNVDLQEPVMESSFNSVVDKLSASMLLDYGRKLNVTAPQQSITEAEFEALLGDGLTLPETEAGDMPTQETMYIEG